MQRWEYCYVRLGISEEAGHLVICTPGGFHSTYYADCVQLATLQERAGCTIANLGMDGWEAFSHDGLGGQDWKAPAVIWFRRPLED